MSVARATEADLDDLRRLLNAARYRFADFGMEDLPNLLVKSDSVLGTDTGVVWGFLGLQTEERPATLPAGAPTRSYLRALALRGGYAPAGYVPPLLEEAFTRLREHGESIQVITYGGDGWVYKVLHDAGFTVADQVQFYELPRPHRELNRLPTYAGPAILLPADDRHLAQLAEMDADAFPPLWHFGHKDMLELLVRTRLQMAMLDNEIVGYTSSSANSGAELQLARLAVRPDVQGRGIGRQLLRDVIRYAASQRYERVILNTQTDNERSQHLYRAFGFRPTSRPVPVLAMTVAPPRMSQP